MCSLHSNKFEKLLPWLTLALALITAIILFWQSFLFQRQVDVMEKGQRPWLSIDVTPTAPITIDSSQALKFSFKHVVKNISNTPANNIQVFYYIEPISESNIFNASPLQKNTCKASNSLANKVPQYNRFLLPNESFEGTEDYIITKERWQPGTTILLVACVTYASNFNGGRGETAIPYELGKKLPSGGFAGFVKSDSIIPLEQISFAKAAFQYGWLR